jgi:uncharacterized membrane protein/mono/diheme cytochrome c family protein
LGLDFKRILPRSKWTARIWIASLAASLAMLMLPWLFRLDGRAHADWQQFLGRFHPLIVHLPIGLVLLVPILEVVGSRKPALREAAGFVLALSVFACLGAVTLGYLLAYGSGEAGGGVARHMWGGIALTISVMACALLRPLWASGKVQGFSRSVYPGLLLFVILLLLWTAHQGGSLTHGRNYLTQYLPAPIKHWGLWNSQSTGAVAPGSFYAKQIDPILDANCVVCHGESKVKGGLRLDSYAALMQGGKDGAVILAGQPDKSLLLQRVTLPTDHKQFMPAEGKPPLKSDQIALIRAWITQGASPTAVSLAGIRVTEEETPPAPVADYSSLIGAMTQAAKSAGVRITQVSKKPGDGLILNTIDAAPGFDDAQLATFEKFAPYVVEVDLARTAITDNSFETLAKFTNLRVLHLEDTAVTGEGLPKLLSLSRLTYLNLSGTKVSQTSIAPLQGMKQLRHLYLYNTPAQPMPATVAEQSPPRKAS